MEASFSMLQTVRELLLQARRLKTVSYTHLVRAQLNQRSIRYNWHEPDVTALEGFLARGDRRCADVILKAYEKGALYDAWTENFDYDIWKEAMAECGVDMTCLLYTSSYGSAFRLL